MAGQPAGSDGAALSCSFDFEGAALCTLEARWAANLAHFVASMPKAFFRARVEIFSASLCRVSKAAAARVPAQAGTMSGTACTVRTRKFMTNRLLQRKQFVRARAEREGFTLLLQPARWRRRAAHAAADSWRRTTTLPRAPQVIDVLHPGRPNVSKARVRRQP
jgi:hypothetical protein